MPLSALLNRNAAALLALAGLAGALGVGLAAFASHSVRPNLALAAQFLLLHAPALIALGLVPAGRLAGIAAWVLAAGLALFCGDLSMRELAGSPLFPYAAPLGGGGLVVGWLLAAIAGLIALRR